jgi:hypothetical protein
MSCVEPPTVGTGGLSGNATAPHIRSDPRVAERAITPPIVPQRKAGVTAVVLIERLAFRRQG